MTNIKEMIDGLVAKIKSLNVLRRKVEPSNASKIKDIEVADIDRDKLKEFNSDPLKVMLTSSSEEIYLQNDITHLGPDKGLTDDQLAEIGKTEDHNTVFKTDYLTAVGKFAEKYNEVIEDFSDKTADSISKVKELVEAFDYSEAFKTKYKEVVTDENKGSDHYDTYVLGKYADTHALLTEQAEVTKVLLELPAVKLGSDYTVKPYTKIIAEDEEKGFSDLYDLYKDKVVLDKPEERTLKEVLDSMAEEKTSKLNEMLLYKAAITKRANDVEDSAIRELQNSLRSSYAFNNYNVLSDEDLETADSKTIEKAMNRYDHGTDDADGSTGYEAMLKEYIEDLIPIEDNMVTPSKWEPLKKAIKTDKEAAKVYRDKLTKAKEKADERKTKDAKALVEKIKALYVTDGESAVSKSHYETVIASGELEDSKTALTELVHAYFVLNTEVKKALEGYETDPVYNEAVELVKADKKEIGDLIGKLRTHVAEKQKASLAEAPYNVETTVLDKEAYTTAIGKLDELNNDVDTTIAFIADSTYHSEDDNNSSIPDDGTSVTAKKALDDYKKAISSKKIKYNEIISEIDDADAYKKEMNDVFNNEEDVKAKLAADPYNADDVKNLLMNDGVSLVKAYNFLAYTILGERSYGHKKESLDEPTHTLYNNVDTTRTETLEKVKNYLNQARNLLVSKLVNLEDSTYKVGDSPTAEEYKAAISALQAVDTAGLESFLDSTGTVESAAIDTEGLDTAKKALKAISDEIAKRVADYTKKEDALNKKAAVDAVDTPSIKGYKKDDDAALSTKITEVTKAINALDEISIPEAEEEDVYAEARSAKTTKMGTLNGLKTKLTNEQSDDAKIATMVKNVTENIARVDGLMTGDMEESHDALSDVTEAPYTARISKLNDFANQYRRDVFDNDTENLTTAFNQLLTSNPDGSEDDDEKDHADYTKLNELKEKVLEKVNAIKARVEKITADKAILTKALAEEGVLKVARDDKAILDTYKLEKLDSTNALKNLSPTELSADPNPFKLIAEDKTYSKIEENNDRPVVTAINNEIEPVIADFNSKREAYKAYMSAYITPATELEEEDHNEKLKEAVALTVDSVKTAAEVSGEYTSVDKSKLNTLFDKLKEAYDKANGYKKADSDTYVSYRTAVDPAETSATNLAEKPKAHLGLLSTKYDNIINPLVDEAMNVKAEIENKSIAEFVTAAKLEEEYKGKTSSELDTVIGNMNTQKEGIESLKTGLSSLYVNDVNSKNYSTVFASTLETATNKSTEIDNKIKEIKAYKEKVVKLEALKLDEAGIEAAYPMPDAASGTDAGAYDTRDSKLKELKTKLEDSGEYKTALTDSITNTGVESGDGNYTKASEKLATGLKEYIAKIEEAISQNQQDKTTNVPK